MTSLSVVFTTVFLYIRQILKIVINRIILTSELPWRNDITIYILLETVFLGQGRYILQNCSREFFPAIAYSILVQLKPYSTGLQYALLE